MSEDWGAIAEDAAAAIADTGFAVTFTRTPAPSGPLDMGPFDPEDQPAMAVQTKTSRAFMARGVEVQVMKTLLVSASFEPREGDRMRIGTNSEAEPSYGVVRVQGLAPGGVDLLFKVDLGG